MLNSCSYVSPHEVKPGVPGFLKCFHADFSVREHRLYIHLPGIAYRVR